MSFDYDNDDWKFAHEWFELGRKKGKDGKEVNGRYVKFMLHWVAFEWLYSGSAKSDDAKTNIRAFCKEHYDECLKSYDPFSTAAIRVFKDGPIWSESYGSWSPNKGIYRQVMHASGEERVEGLLCSLYAVRCNLFHGSKTLRIKRDVELVESSSIILEGYLERLFDGY